MCVGVPAMVWELEHVFRKRGALRLQRGSGRRTDYFIGIRLVTKLHTERGEGGILNEEIETKRLNT